MSVDTRQLTLIAFDYGLATTYATMHKLRYSLAGHSYHGYIAVLTQTRIDQPGKTSALHAAVHPAKARQDRMTDHTDVALIVSSLYSQGMIAAVLKLPGNYKLDVESAAREDSAVLLAFLFGPYHHA